MLSSPPSDEELPWPYNTFDLHAQRRTGGLIPAADSLGSVVRGTLLVAHSIAPAFGPQGASVSIALEPQQSQACFRSGYKIVQGVRTEDPLEQQGIEQMKQLAAEMYSSVGDATKTALFLCSSMVEDGASALRSGSVPKALVAGMQRAVDTAVAHVMTEAKNVEDQQLRAIARTAAGFDEPAAAIVIEALKRVGKNGIVEILDGADVETELTIQEGMQFENGFLSQSFITDMQRQECILQDCYLLICEGQISSMQMLLPIMAVVARTGKPLLVIASDVAQEALATLILNKERGTLPAAAIKAPGQGDRRRAILEDIAVLTGGKAFLQERMRPLEDAGLPDLGRAERIIITRSDTTIIGGKGRTDEIESRIQSLHRRIESTPSPYDNAKLRERLARLAGAIGLIRSGGVTQDERADSRYRLESALFSCRSALANGYVIGGGLCYHRAKRMLEKLVAANESEQQGINAVSRALELPLHKLVENSSIYNKGKILVEITASDPDTVGLNAESEQIEDLTQAGILDSASALKEALTRAFAHAKGILIVGAWDSAAKPGPRSNEEVG